MSTQIQTSNKATESKATVQSKAEVQAKTLASGAAFANEEHACGPVADPVQSGAVAYRQELSACQTPAFYVQAGRSMARATARKQAKSAILAALSGKAS